ARICFTTSDRNNSHVILDQEGAENLGRIEGRAIYLDSTTNIIQVPYMNTETSYDLLAPYRKEAVHNENDENEKRSNDTELANKIQSLFEESDSNFDIHQQRQPNQRMQSSIKTTNNERTNLSDTTHERSNISIHPEPVTDQPPIKQNRTPPQNSRFLH